MTTIPTNNRVSGTILLVLANNTNSHLLTAFLSPCYHIINVKACDLLQLPSTWDLCILDGLSLKAINQWLVNQKNAAAPVFLPSLLVTSNQELKRTSNQLYDDVLLTPINVQELAARIISLLKLRQLSLENHTLYKMAIISNEHLMQERTLREQFVASLIHDFNSPLTTAKLLSNIIGRTVTDAKQLKYFQQMDATLTRMGDMIQNLLDVYLINAGKALPLKLVKCDLNKVAQQTVQDLTVKYGDRFILLSTTSGKGMWDAQAIRRALENLCHNAIKYGALDKPIIVGLKAGQNNLQLYVHNQGTPLNRSDQQQIFQLFQRTDSATKSQQPGWGIGLVLVRGVAEAHGGRLTVKSNLKVGTTFSIHLPLRV